MSEQANKRPVGLKLVVAFLAMSAGTSALFAAWSSSVPPDQAIVPDHLLGLPETFAPEALLRYMFELLLNFVFSTPLLYGGVAKGFGLDSLATGHLLLCVALLFGLMAWQVYRFHNWARRLFLALCWVPVFAMLKPFPPFWVHSIGAMVAFLPFLVPYGLIFLYLRSENLRHSFGVGTTPISFR